jgi:hypothetical protein
MCDPVTIIAGTSAALSIGSTVAGHKAQKKAAKENARAAGEADRLNRADLSARAVEEQQAAQSLIEEAGRQTAEQRGLATASAAEAGVTGMSVDLLLADLDRAKGVHKTSVTKNLANVEAQLGREKQGSVAQRQSRINALTGPSLGGSALQVGAAGLDFANVLIRRNP